MRVKRLTIEVGGRVQGVGFRAFVSKEARIHGVFGFVKNLPDGNVYIDAEGEEEALLIFKSKCLQGPSWSNVSSYSTQETEPKGYNDFEIRY